MALPSINHFIIDFFMQLDVLMKHYVHDGYNALVQVLRIPLGMAISLYTSIFIYYWYAGEIRLTTKEISWAIIKVCLIYSLAMNWDFFSQYLVNFITDGANLVGSALIKAAPVHLPHNENIANSLQLMLLGFLKFAQALFKLGSFHNPLPYFEGGVIYLVGGLLSLVAIIELAIAKIFLSILFAMAPLFCGLALFKTTQNLFDNWLREIIGFALWMIFVAAVLGFIFALFELLLPMQELDHLSDIGFGSSAMVFILGGFGIYLLLQAAKQGKQLASHVSTISGSSTVGAMVGSFIGNAGTTMRLPKTAMKEMKSWYGTTAKSARWGASKFNSIKKSIQGGD